MKRLILIIAVLFFTEALHAQNFRTVKFEEVEKILDSKNDTTYLINFWATWCGPCVEEIPYFEELTKKYELGKFKVILISMDFKSDVEKRLVPFLEKKKYNSEIWWLDEAKQSDLIGKIEKEWYGEIPFTVIYRGVDNRRFWKAGKWEKENLDSKVNEILYF